MYAADESGIQFCAYTVCNNGDLVAFCVMIFVGHESWTCHGSIALVRCKRAASADQSICALGKPPRPWRHLPWSCRGLGYLEW